MTEQGKLQKRSVPETLRHVWQNYNFILVFLVILLVFLYVKLCKCILGEEMLLCI